ncbi:2OG-Fe(II) oxygenase family oxidoreductase, partial [Trifolium pratense]
MVYENNNNNNNNNNLGKNRVVVFGDADLAWEQTERIRFMNVKPIDFIGFESIDGKRVNILEGLELHTGVFNAAEQKGIVDYVAYLQDKGRKKELK